MHSLLNQVAACMDLFTTPRLVALACCSELAAAGLTIVITAIMIMLVLVLVIIQHNRH